MKNNLYQVYEMMETKDLIEALILAQEKREQEQQVTCEYFDYKSNGRKRGTAHIRFKGILLKGCTLFQEEKDGQVIGNICMPSVLYKDREGKTRNFYTVEIAEDEFKEFERAAIAAIAAWCEANPKKQDKGVPMNGIL